MARLNEAPQPAPETLESLKRRFIRQNRDLARVNSSQSIRIKNLETQISQLISENAALREQVLAAQREAKRYRCSAHLPVELMHMKTKLKTKLAEVDALFDELEALPEKAEGLARERRSERQKRRNQHLRVSDEPRIQRERPQRQTVEGEEARLPAIVEHKSYPRRTLDAQELPEMIVEDDNDSPEIGPPPVGHFEGAECIGFNLDRSPRRTSKELIAESERHSLGHVESRRKRRTSSLVLPLDAEQGYTEQPLVVRDPGLVADLQETRPEKQDRSTPAMRAGMKRKLSMSEADEAKRPKELSDFTPEKNLSNTISTVKPSRFTKASIRQAQGIHVQKLTSPIKHELSSRKILAPKTTNSPAKKKLDSLSKSEAAKRDIDLTVHKRTVMKVRSKNTAVILPEAEVTESETEQKHTVALPPKTPAADIIDVFSPASTEPSTKQKVPSELAPMTSVEDVLNGSMGRGSRRTRPAVSYAEPSLRDKMRRPGKELVGAVEGLTKPVVTTDRVLNRARSTGGGLDVESKSEAPSPLRDKQAPSDRLERVHKSPNDDLLKEAVSRLSLFDHPESSPAADGMPATNTIRRSSSVTVLPRLQHIDTKTSKSYTTPNKQATFDMGIPEVQGQPPSRATTLSRRRSMMA